MNSLGRKKLLGIAVAAVLGMGLVPQAQATIFYDGTVSSWDLDSPVLDADGDSEWSLLSFDGDLGLAGVQLAEEEFPGVDWYTVAIDFTKMAGGGIQDATYTLTYMAEQLTDELFSSAHLDSTHVGGGTMVTKEIYDGVTGTLLLTLTSEDGSTDEGLYAPTRIIKVVETYSAGPNGELHESTNSFDVPEPATVALLGLGMVGLGLSRRRTA